jgi:hypothetical protein
MRKIEFVVTLPKESSEILKRVGDLLSDNAIAIPLDIEVSVEEGITEDMQAEIQSIPELAIDFVQEESATARLIITSEFGMLDTTRFRNIIETIIVVLHQNGCLIEESATGSNHF